MTTVVVDKRRGMMVGDKLGTGTDAKILGRKVFKVRGDLVGGAGYVSDLSAFVELYKKYGLKAKIKLKANHLLVDKDSGPTIVVLTKERKILVSYNKELVFSEYDGPYHAVGTGTAAATAFIICNGGEVPDKIMSLVSQVDNDTGPEQDVIYLDDCDENKPKRNRLHKEMGRVQKKSVRPPSRRRKV